jgi:preprotein translocase SecE subunit
LREVREEMNKVAWPKWPEVRRYSIVVLVTVVIFTSIIGVTDTAVGFITDWLYKS